MDFTMIAAGIITAVVPYLAKAGEKIFDKSVDEAFEKRGQIWETAKEMFLGDDLNLLNLFEETPEDAKMQGKIEVKLEDKLKENPEKAEKLEALLKEIPASAKTNTLNITGDNNKTVQDATDSTITIS